jgi:hypothetical protein
MPILRYANLYVVKYHTRTSYNNMVSIGDESQTHLRTTFTGIKLYALNPAQIVTTMTAVATGDDIKKLNEPLSQALMFSDLEKQMGKYLLMDYAYFETYPLILANPNAGI